MAAFYDDTKSRDENQREYEKARHNKEVVQWFTACVAGVTICCGAVMAVRKLYQEFG